MHLLLSENWKEINKKIQDIISRNPEILTFGFEYLNYHINLVRYKTPKGHYRIIKLECTLVADIRNLEEECEEAKN